MLLQHGATVNARDNVDVARLLVAARADVHALNDEALRITAVEGKHLEVVKLLLDNDADIHALNDQALRMASSGGKVDAVALLLSRGAACGVFVRAHRGGHCAAGEWCGRQNARQRAAEMCDLRRA